MSDVIDLDALAPQDVTIKFQDQLISVKPPTMGAFMKLVDLGMKLDNDELDPEMINKLAEDLKAAVVNCIPELEGKELSVSQLTKLVEVIARMVVPPDAKELKDRGISSDDPKDQ